MKNKFKYFSLLLTFLFALIFNFSVEKGASKITSVQVTSSKAMQVEACVTIKFYAHNMEPCFNSSYCYGPGGSICGEQRCCKSCGGDTECNEYECKTN